MEIQSFQPVNFEELRGAPESMRDAIERYNRQVDSLTTALQGNLTASDNEHSEIIEIELEQNESASISLKKLKGKPVAAWVVYSDHYETHQFAWEIVDQKTVNVKIRWTTDPLEPKTVRILFRGE